MNRIIKELRQERRRQDDQFGEQNHPDGTGAPYDLAAYDAHELVESRMAADNLTWDLILLEEVYEALAETDEVNLRTELVEVAAVAIAWIEAIDRRTQQ